MPEANLLINLGAVLEAEGWWLCRRENYDGAITDLDGSRSQFVVDRPVRPMPDGSRHLQDILRPNVDRTIDDALDNPGVIAKVHEGKVFPVLPTSADPAAHAHHSTDIADPDFSAEHISQGGRPLARSVVVRCVDHPIAPVFLAASTRSSTKTVRCSASSRSLRMVTDAADCSSFPMIRATGAP